MGPSASVGAQMAVLGAQMASAGAQIASAGAQMASVGVQAAVLAAQMAVLSAQGRRPRGWQICEGRIYQFRVSKEAVDPSAVPKGTC